MARKAKKLTVLLDPRWDDFVKRYAFDLNRFAFEVCGQKSTWQQIDLFNSVQYPGSRTSVASGHGCFAPGTPIMLASGEVVPVERVLPGDTVMGPDGASTRNVMELRQGREAMYRFTYMDGTSHVFNESHILCLVATNSKGRRIAGEKVTVTVREWLTWGKDKRRCHSIYRSGVDVFRRKAQPQPIPPYILGVWLGDGSSGRNAVTTADPEIEQALQVYAQSIGCAVVCHGFKGAAKALNITTPDRGRVAGGGYATNPMKEALRSLGLLGAKFIPDAYLYGARVERLELLAGLIDTDGHLDNGSGGFEFVQKSKQLAHQVAWLARSVGCHATLREVTKTCCNNGVEGQYWRVTIGRNVQQIPVRIARKKPLDIKRQRPNLHFGIRKVDALGEGEYFGFVLDGDNRFLGGDFTVLHNTGKSRSLGIIALWHLMCFHYSNTLITAPKIEQVRNVAWKEIADLKDHIRQGAESWIADMFVVEAERVYMTGFKDQWFVIAKTAPRGSPENLAGMHRDWYLIIADEASGVTDGNFGVLTGGLTDARNRMLMTSQPTRNTGFFYDTHHGLSKARGGPWNNLTFNSEESPLVSREFILEKRNEYGGITDPQYQIKVRGRFPENLVGQLLSRSALEKVIGDVSCVPDGVDYGNVMLVDVGAGEYRDKSVVIVAKVYGNGQPHEDDARRVHVTRIPICSNTISETALIGEVMQIAGRLSNVTILVDGGGIGGPMIKRLQELGQAGIVKVMWGNFCFKKSLKEVFFNQRSQAMVTIARAAKAGQLSIDASAFGDTRIKTEFLDQGSRIPYHFNDKAQYVIESKRSKEWEGLPSPDIWDALSFAFLEDAQYLTSDAPDGADRPETLRQATVNRLEAELEAAMAG